MSDKNQNQSNTPTATAVANEPVKIQDAHKSEIETLREQLAGMESVMIQTATDFVPLMLTQRLIGALAQKYNVKWRNAPAERAAHIAAFPAYANNTGMLYILSSAQKEAEDKILADEPAVNVSNLTSEVNSYTLAEVLTAHQSEKNKETDARITLLGDKIGDNHGERITCLKAVRKTWLTMFDAAYKAQMDNKLRRAAHQLGVTAQELER